MRVVRHPLLTLVCCLLLGSAGGASAASPSSIMSDAMIAMMDAMGSMAQQYKNKGNWSLGNNFSPYKGWSGMNASPWNPYGMPGGWPGGMPMQSPIPGYGGLPLQGTTPYAPPFLDQQPAKSAVDGIWLGQSGELVLVMYGHFRIYASAEVYRDGLFEISGDKLMMYDPETDRRMIFEYALEDGRMILRGADGSMMLFKQLPIPIPPYTLFSQGPAPYR
ncbi:MAG: hypothetical protein P8178_04355 [Candidatus Thiodiazotropha sp.]